MKSGIIAAVLALGCFAFSPANAVVLLQKQNEFSSVIDGKIKIERDNSQRIGRITMGANVLEYIYNSAADAKPAAVKINGRVRALTQSQQNTWTPASARAYAVQNGFDLKKSLQVKNKMLLRATDCGEEEGAISERSPMKNGTSTVDMCGSGSVGGGVGGVGGDGGEGGGGDGGGDGGSGGDGGNGSGGEPGGSTPGGSGEEGDPFAGSPMEDPNYWDAYFAPDFDVSSFKYKGPQCKIETTYCIQQCDSSRNMYTALCVGAAAVVGTRSVIAGAIVGGLCGAAVWKSYSNCLEQCQINVICN